MKSLQEKILLFMNYDVSKTSKENLETIKEQINKSELPKQSIDNTFVNKQIDFKPDITGIPQLNSKALNGTSKPVPPTPVPSISMPNSKTPIPYTYTRYEGNYSNNYQGYTTYKFNSDKLDFWNKIYKEDLKKWNEGNSDPLGDYMIEHKHGLMDIASLALSFAGTPGLIASTGIDLLNAGLYGVEGNKYEQGLRLAFLLIPFHQLVNTIRPVRKLGEKGLKKLLSKASKNAILNSEEKEVLEALEKNSKWIKSEVSKRVYRQIVKNAVKNFTIPNFVKFLWVFSKKHPLLSGLMKMTITIGGITYTWNEVAKIFGISEEKSKNIEKMRKMVEDFNENPVKYTEEMQDGFVEYLMSIPDAENIVLDAYK